MHMDATPTFAILDRLISRCIMHMFLITRSASNEGWCEEGVKEVKTGRERLKENLR
jgi:hypothetical protein